MAHGKAPTPRARQAVRRRRRQDAVHGDAEEGDRVDAGQASRRARRRRSRSPARTPRRTRFRAAARTSSDRAGGGGNAPWPIPLTDQYDLTKPEVEASQDTWGDKLNQDLDELDVLLFNRVVKRRESKDAAGENPQVMGLHCRCATSASVAGGDDCRSRSPTWRAGMLARQCALGRVPHHLDAQQAVPGRHDHDVVAARSTDDRRLGRRSAGVSAMAVRLRRICRIVSSSRRAAMPYAGNIRPERQLGAHTHQATARTSIPAWRSLSRTSTSGSNVAGDYSTVAAIWYPSHLPALLHRAATF